MDKKYFITDGRRQIGPLTLATIESMVLSGQMSLFDSVLDSQTNSWIPYHKLVSEQAETKIEKTKKGTQHILVGLDQGNSFSDVRAGTGTFAHSPNLQLWFVKSGKLVEGPMTFVELLAMVKEGSVTEQDQVKNDTGHWTPAKDCPELSKKNLGSYNLELAKELMKKSFFRRSQKRTKTSETLWIKSSLGVHMARLNDVSTSGCSFNSPFEVAAQSAITMYLKPELVGAEGSVVECLQVKDGNDMWYKIRVHLTQVTPEWKFWVSQQEAA
jgi:hypothetical protein